MPCNFSGYSVGDSVLPVSAEIESEVVPIYWPSDYGDLGVVGYAAWILPSPSDLVSLVGWRVVLRHRRNKGGASTDPREFIKHLMVSTQVTSLATLERNVDARMDHLRQYLSFTKESQECTGETESDRQETEIRWMSTKSLRTLILAVSIENRNRHGISIRPTVQPGQSPDCKPLRPTETGSMLRVLDQDELYARLGSSWRIHIRDRRRIDEQPTIGDLPWLGKKASVIAGQLWDRHTVFEKRCLAKAVRRKSIHAWDEYHDLPK